MSGFEQADPWPYLEALAAHGGRLSGTASEARAREWATAKLREACAVEPAAEPVPYDGWTRGETVLELAADGTRLAADSLLLSPPTPPGGLVAEVVDLGRGTEADFTRHADLLPGRIALVRHEFMFAHDTVPRWHKYGWAMRHGAAGFLIASHLPGDQPVTGSTSMRPGEGIPAAGIGAESAARLAGRPRVRLRIACTGAPAVAENLVVDLPGRSAGTVVLCAHLDGHHLAQSAMDNGTGVAAVLAVARALAPRAASFVRGLRVALFNVEEWNLTGSRTHVERLSQAGRDAVALVVNLDSIAGSPRLAAFTSGFPRLAPFLSGVAAGVGRTLAMHPPLLANSDHYPFAAAGVPAFRLVAGFDEPGSALRHLLTPGDTLDKVPADQLRDATRLVTAIVHAACTAPALDLRGDG